MKRRSGNGWLASLLGIASVALLAGGRLLAQESEPPADTVEGAADTVQATADTVDAAAEATAPPIGLIEFYGLRTIPKDSLRTALGLPPEPAAGASVPESPVMEKAALPLLAARLAASPRIGEARFETVCCHQGRTILFIGIREAGAEGEPDRRPEPTGEVRLPEEIIRAYEGFLEALTKAVEAGRAGDDLSQGHSLVADSAARSYQLRFLELAETHLDLLRRTLAESADAGHRAVAAAVIGYAKDKGSVAPDLVRALRDTDPNVRNNATRSLAAIAVYAKERPDVELEIPIEPLAGMLESVDWTDRNKALSLLVYLTGPGDREILSLLRREALDALVEMARWRSPGHALPALILLGRMAGSTDEETLQALREGRREEVIARAAAGPEG